MALPIVASERHTRRPKRSEISAIIDVVIRDPKPVQCKCIKKGREHP